MNHLVKNKLILALDIDTANEAINIVEKFSNVIDIFKVGLQLFCNSGPTIIEKIHKKGKKVFLDLKFHDIPTTVAKAAVQVTRIGVEMFTIHASGGSEMMNKTQEAVVETCLKENLLKPKIIAVTVLTNISKEEFITEIGYQHSIETHVKHLATLAKDAGLDGVVAAGNEVAILRKKFGEKFIIVTPAVRLSWMPLDEQKRRVTPKEALRAGANYLIIGRAVLSAENPDKAIAQIISEIISIQ